MEKFNKKDRSTWPYFWAHWFAFQMTAVMLHRWKFKYLFHDWYKPWLKMFGWEYKRIQTFHRNHSNHHIEYLLNTLFEKDSNLELMHTKFDWEELIIDWQCSQYTKSACPRGARKEMERYAEETKGWMGESMHFYLTCAFENCMKPLLDEMNLND